MDHTPNASTTKLRKATTLAHTNRSVLDCGAVRDGAASRLDCCASSISSRASAIARKRLVSFFSKHRRSKRRTDSGVSGARRLQSGSFESTLARISLVVAAANAGRPVSISNSRQPKAHTSDRASAVCPLTCSGDIYAAVPSNVPGMDVIIVGA